MKTKDIILATILVATCSSIDIRTVERISEESGVPESEVYAIMRETYAAKSVAEADMKAN